MLSIRKPRRVPPAGPTPPVGAAITLHDLRMKIDMPMSSELWTWLQLSGWRKVPVRKDRRKCVDLPADVLLVLMQTPLAQRDALHRRIVKKYSKLADK